MGQNFSVWNEKTADARNVKQWANKTLQSEKEGVKKRGKQTNNSERGQEKERDLKRKGKREVERETKGNREEK